MHANAINPKNGTWWNPAEGGRGFTLDGSGSTLMVGAFVYGTDGMPMWYLAVGQLTNNGANWSASLDKYQYGQCLSCVYKPSQLLGNDGTISIAFSSDTKGVMTLPNGSKINIESFFPAGSVANAIAPVLGFPITFKTIRMDTLTYATDPYGGCKATLTFTNIGSTLAKPYLYFDVVVGNVAVKQVIFNFSIAAGTTAANANSIYDSSYKDLDCGTFALRFNEAASAVY